ncbi:MAG: DUF2784 domain-containing protein [Planctomycetaceae bacterium]
MNLWLWLANGVLLVHLAFVLFVVLGGGLVWWRPGWAVWHLPAAAWGAAVEFFQIICPLTYLENWLRIQGGQEAGEADFIQRVILSVLYPAGLTPGIQFVLGCVVLAINVPVYVTLARRGGWLFPARQLVAPADPNADRKAS